jgi:hypothetical protein
MTGDYRQNVIIIHLRCCFKFYGARHFTLIKPDFLLFYIL